MDKVQLGKAFMQDLLNLVPEADRANPEALLAALQSDAVAEAAGAGGMRLSDYSRSMNEADAKRKAADEHYAALNGWHTKVQAELKAAGIDPTTLKPVAPHGTPPGLSSEKLDEQLNERERGQLAFVLAKDKLRDQHLALFGEPLDVQQLIVDPEINKLGLNGVYEKQFGVKVAEKRQAAETARIDKIVADRLAEERSKLASAPPYPVASSSAHVSALTGLPADTPGVSDGLVDKAVTLHNQLVAERMRPTG